MITRITTTTATAIIMFLFLSGPSNMAIAPSLSEANLGQYLYSSSVPNALPVLVVSQFDLGKRFNADLRCESRKTKDSLPCIEGRLFLLVEPYVSSAFTAPDAADG